MYSVTGIYGCRNKAFGFENESSGYRKYSNTGIPGFKTKSKYVRKQYAEDLQ